MQNYARTAGLDVAQQFGDHADLRTTMSHYANARDRMAEAAEAVELPPEFYEQ